MHILEYSPTEGYHISTEEDHARNKAICEARGIVKDYKVIGAYAGYDEAKARQNELMNKGKLIEK